MLYRVHYYAPGDPAMRNDTIESPVDAKATALVFHALNREMRVVEANPCNVHGMLALKANFVPTSWQVQYIAMMGAAMQAVDGRRRELEAEALAFLKAHRPMDRDAYRKTLAIKEEKTGGGESLWYIRERADERGDGQATCISKSGVEWIVDQWYKSYLLKQVYQGERLPRTKEEGHTLRAIHGQG